ncbi:hypothetical protein [Pseudooceanicola sp.]|uniref:hypothetical protein n=1 Tax=Pseudooceanicola sp. TaxID=1914328 RepID=UPI0026123E96|nr:hypothetical protein [Pseudooceanicola sp.]MDF1854239.1 hypothetical protein [Pseudooceanicola sp.]
MSWSFYELDAALSDAASSVFAEPALLRPRVSTQYAERSADSDRAATVTYGIFSAGPAKDDLGGQARGGQMSGTTKLSTAATEFWIAKPQIDQLPWLPITGDVVILTARNSQPIYAISRVATSDLGDLTLMLVREDETS